MANTKRNKTPKTELIFDNKKREEFLTGFTKRKQQRKKKAAEENEKKLKEEKKRIKDETKNLKDKFKQSFKPIEELKDILSDEEENGFETEDVKVTISAIKPEEYAKKNFIGYRRVQMSESEEESEKEASETESKEIPGMETTQKTSNKAKVVRDKDFEKLTEKLKSEKDVKKLIKQTAKTAMKKSKIIKMQNDTNHKRNVKLSQRKKYLKEKKLRKHKKIPKQKSN